MLRMQQLAHPIESLSEAIEGNRIVSLQSKVREVHVAASVRRYILNMVNATRTNPALGLGASPRGSLALFRTAQARAAVDGRNFALPDDVKSIAVACLAHRMVVNPENAMGGETTETIVQELLKQVEVQISVDQL